MKWEYRSFDVPALGLADELNQLGAQDWEAFSISPTGYDAAGGAFWLRVVLKRPIDPPKYMVADDAPPPSSLLPGHITYVSSFHGPLRKR